MSSELVASADTPMWDAWLSSTWFPSVLAAEDLGVFSAIARAPSSSDAIADGLALDRRATQALLSILASLGLLKGCNGLYSVTETAREYLLAQSPGYWGGVLSLCRRSDPMYARLKHVLARPAVFNARAAREQSAASGWATGALSREQAETVTGFMQSHSAFAAAKLASTIDFSRGRRLLDVGGGSACYSIALAERNPHLECTLLELPSVCDVAVEYIARAGLSDRVRVIPLDMFKDAWPRDYDAVLLSNVLHDWAPTVCEQILERAFAALPRGGRIYVHEALLDEDRCGPRTTAAFSIWMVLYTFGQQYTYGDLAAVLGKTGFGDVERVATSPLYTVVSASRK